MNIKVTIAAFISAVICVGCSRSPSGDEETRPPVPVKVAVARTGEITPTIDLVGSLISVPEKTVILSSQIGGSVEKLNVVEGLSVQAGDPIIELDARLIEADVNKAAAAVEQAQANLKLLEKGPLPGEIEASRQEARNAAATAESQNAKFKALEPLHARGEISDVQFQMGQSALTEAQASSEAANQRLKLMQAGTRPELVDQARAQLKAAESDLAAQKLNRQLCTVTSPIAGIVTQLPVRQGMSVDKATVLATIVDLSSVLARVHMPASYLGHVKSGAAATVTLNAPDAVPREGSILRVGKEADERTGDLDVFVTLDNADGMLVPGLGCRVALSLPAIAGAVIIPISAVADENGETVIVIVRENKAFQTVVKIGAKTESDVQIIEGLAVGDTVVTEGGYGLPEGCPVTIESADIHDPK